MLQDLVEYHLQDQVFLLPDHQVAEFKETMDYLLVYLSQVDLLTDLLLPLLIHLLLLQPLQLLIRQLLQPPVHHPQLLNHGVQDQLHQVELPKDSMVWEHVYQILPVLLSAHSEPLLPLLHRLPPLLEAAHPLPNHGEEDQPQKHLPLVYLPQDLSAVVEVVSHHLVNMVYPPEYQSHQTDLPLIEFQLLSDL